MGWHHATPSFTLCLYPIFLCLYCITHFHPSYLIIYLFVSFLPLLKCGQILSVHCCCCAVNNVALSPEPSEKPKRKAKKGECTHRNVPKVLSCCQKIAVTSFFIVGNSPLARISNFLKLINPSNLICLRH